MNIETIQQFVALEKADAWVMVDYECKNPAMNALLGHKMLTRKIFMVIPAIGKPYLITHLIDTVYLKDEVTTDRFDLKIYKTWREMLDLEKACFSSYKTVLMDISEFGLLPRVSLADWGSVEFIRSLGVSIKPSANVLQRLTAVYSERAYQLQLKANEIALRIKDEAFRKIKESIENFGEADEYEIQQFIAKRFHEEGMVFDDPPLVAIGKNASDPHYSPTKEVHDKIHEDDLVLIDMWAKMNDPEGGYSDITW
ncbi:MAG: M24 family metallopeptidase, partial [Bacilli bacterium]|nr:M24 family metallopeptidase [Bacilli bacterium]